MDGIYVTWLASWTENIQGQIKYVMLNPTSRLKKLAFFICSYFCKGYRGLSTTSCDVMRLGEKDLAKYETVKRLKGRIEEIRRNYESDLKSRETAGGCSVFHKLALGAGNEKDADEAADTVGCCSLRVEHIKLHEELDGKSDMVEFDFLGKDSIRYYNKVQ
uniref:DNA topoisomerase n=1 Tax=Amphimedon queenslandica TaxID=400682 RepID=A0A1X7UJ18_AMPQE